MRDGPHGAVVTHHAGRARTWSRPFDGLDLMRVDVRGGRVLLSGGGRNQLRVHALDPKTGADITPPATLGTPLTGDRGGISAIVDSPAGPEMVGHSGRPPVRGKNGATESHSIEPFALQLGRPDRDRRQIVDAIATVAAAGRIGGVLATVIDVIHTGPRYGGTSPSHPGTWLTLGVGDTLRTVPIHTRGGGSKTGIDYVSPSPGSMIAGERLILMGRCNARGDLGCVVVLSLR